MPTETFCQNCGLAFEPKNPTDWNSGDRVLVGKYEYHIRDPAALRCAGVQVPVRAVPFAFEKTAMNYIKRLIGLPGETIAIYTRRSLPDHGAHLLRTDRVRASEDAENCWHEGLHLRERRRCASSLFNNGGFELIRKSPKQILTVRRLVFDLDRQPKSTFGHCANALAPVPDDSAGWTMQDKGFNHMRGCISAGCATITSRPGVGDSTS